jgi:hypothetical protein
MTIAIGMPRTHKRASPTVSAESDSGRAFGGTAPARAIGPGSAFFRAPEAVRLPVPGRVVALRLKRPRRRCSPFARVSAAVGLDALESVSNGIEGLLLVPKRQSSLAGAGGPRRGAGLLKWATTVSHVKQESPLPDSRSPVLGTKRSPGILAPQHTPDGR